MRGRMRGHVAIVVMGCGPSLAGQNGQDMVRLLIESGAGVDAPGGSGETALMSAAFRGFTGMAKLLLENGADVNHRPKYGGTALELAVRNGEVGGSTA